MNNASQNLETYGSGAEFPVSGLSNQAGVNRHVLVSGRQPSDAVGGGVHTDVLSSSCTCEEAGREFGARRAAGSPVGTEGSP